MDVAANGVENSLGGNGAGDLPSLVSSHPIRYYRKPHGRVGDGGVLVMRALHAGIRHIYELDLGGEVHGAVNGLAGFSRLGAATAARPRGLGSGRIARQFADPSRPTTHDGQVPPGATSSQPAWRKPGCLSPFQRRSGNAC